MVVRDVEFVSQIRHRGLVAPPEAQCVCLPAVKGGSEVCLVSVKGEREEGGCH